MSVSKNASVFNKCSNVKGNIGFLYFSIQEYSISTKAVIRSPRYANITSRSRRVPSDRHSFKTGIRRGARAESPVCIGAGALRLVVNI